MNNNIEKIKGIGDKFKGLTTIGVANISATAISGIFWFYIAALLGTTHYGEVSYVIAVSGLALTFSLFGSGNALLVYTAKGVKIQPPVYFISLTAIAVTCIVLYFMFYNIGLCILVIGNGVFGIVTVELLGLKLYKKYAQYFITQRIVMVILAISLYYLMGYNGIVIGIGLSYFLAFTRIYHVFKGCSRIDFSLIRSRFHFMFTSYVLDISRTFAGTIDKIIVAPMLGFALLGNYQLGMQFLSVLMIFPGILYNYIVPHDASGTENNKLKKYAVIFSIVIVIPSVILSPKILPVLFPRFTEAIPVIQIISISIIPITISNIYISKFLGNERIKIVLIGSAIFVVIQIITIFTLGNIFSVKGVAVSYVLATISEAAYLISVDRWSSKNLLRSDGKNISQESVVVRSLKKIRLDFSSRIALYALITIGVVGLFLRLHNFPYNIPLTLDAFNSYFLYATDVSILGSLPNWSISNNGWPLFLSTFFSIFHFSNFIDYMNLQRLVTISISILTIIPVYFLCRRFFNRFYSVLGAALFTFEPHIIQNSSLGLSDPLFIMLSTSSIMLFFGSNLKSKLIAFAIIGLSTTVRIEALFVFFAFSFSFIIQNRHEKKFVIKYLFGLGVFLAVLLPFILLRIRTYGEDFISSRVLGSTNAVITESIHENSKSLVSSFLLNLENILKLGGWSLIPYFVILMPIGIYLILRKRDRNLNTILIIMVFMLIPVAIAFSWAQDTRYIYPLFSIFCVVSIFPIIKFVEKYNAQKILAILIVITILFSSISYLEIKKNDLNHQEEAANIAQHVVSFAKGINDYYPEDSYIGPSAISGKWPALKSAINFKTNIISTDGFDSLQKYIESSRGNGLTHLVVDDNKKRPDFLKDVFYHENKYPYLVKVYDSSDNNFRYHLKVYEINYDEFDKNQTR